jgi:predicted dehydrogenase
VNKIRIAHLGLAHDHSIFAMECIRSMPDIFEVVGVCEPNDHDRAMFGTQPVYEGLSWLSEYELFHREDIDCVLCEGHELRSVADAQKCLDHGLHVHLDKPGGTDLQAFIRLWNTANERNLTLHMGYMYRYNPAYKYILESVRADKYGHITGIDGSFSIQHNAQKRQWLKQFPGGMMFFLGCHMLDLVLRIMGEPRKVLPFNYSSGDENNKSLDTTMVVLEYTDCACCIRANATEANGFYNRNLKLVGTKGMVEIKPLENPTIIREAMIDQSAINPWRDNSYSVFPGYIAGRYRDMFLEFARCVRGEMINPYTSDYEILLQKILLLACS